MDSRLAVSLGQHSAAGRKDENQDFHGALVPDAAALAAKGIAVAIADGISSSAVGRVAAESAVKSFLTDYYCTADSWSVRTSAQRVIAATNSWLHAQNRRAAATHDPERGYVCTFSALVLKSRTAHLFHVGDTRIYQAADGTLEQLTTDHRVSLSPQENYLARALGANAHVEIDHHVVTLQAGDLFVLTSDGVHEHATEPAMAAAIAAHPDDLDAAARAIVDAALANGSPDNLTAQVVRIDALPAGEIGDLIADGERLPPAPLLEPRSRFEGYEILRAIHSSDRSHIYLARDEETGERVALKVPSTELRSDADHLRRFMREEWVARRLDNAHVLKAPSRPRRRDHLYVVTEFVEGQTLAQWMADNPAPSLERVRSIVEQMARGLQAFHRKEMLHQDLRPANVMIDPEGTVRIIDFGAVWIAGASEMDAMPRRDAEILGTTQYTAPEYFLGTGVSPASDIYSLGVIAYQMLTGQLPYGAEVAKLRTPSQLWRLSYAPASEGNPAVSSWVDAALAKAVHPDQTKRYGELSEFTYDLRHPNMELADLAKRPLLQRNPVRFWKIVSGVLLALLVLVLWRAGPAIFAPTAP